MCRKTPESLTGIETFQPKTLMTARLGRKTPESLTGIETGIGASNGFDIGNRRKTPESLTGIETYDF